MSDFKALQLLHNRPYSNEAARVFQALPLGPLRIIGAFLMNWSDRLPADPQIRETVLRVRNAK